ncbi:YraN family protein [Fusibacter sp. JL298sf-3]
MANKQVGTCAEQAARHYLKVQGYTFKKANYRCRFGEMDLIVVKDEVHYFVEVKYRRTRRFGSPREAITSEKIRRLERIAVCYMREHRLEGLFKLSFIGVEPEGDTWVYDFMEDIL